MKKLTRKFATILATDCVGFSQHMLKFNGVPKAEFRLYLKECEWRFNNSDPSRQLTQLKQWVKKYLN